MVLAVFVYVKIVIEFDDQFLNKGVIQMFSTIGRVKIKLDEFVDDFNEIYNKEKSDHSIWQAISKQSKVLSSDDFKFLSKAHDNMFSASYYFESQKSCLERFLVVHKEASDLNISWKCFYLSDEFAVVGPSSSLSSCFTVPLTYLEIEKYKDYSELTGSERQAVLSGVSDQFESLPISKDEVCMKDVDNLKEEQENQLHLLKEQRKKIEESKCKELEELKKKLDEAQRELDEKKSQLLKEMDAKLESLKDMMRSTEIEILKLDSEIYAIRCFTGEIVEFKKLKSGVPGKDDQPIIFYQKMRYLDEELGKIRAIYDADFSAATYFEDLLKTDRHFEEAFAPNDRSIMLVRVSRSGVGFCRGQDTNILEKYEKYHGEKVGIILRDGENLYIGWTDDDRVYFSEDAFFKPGEYEANEEEFSKLEQGKYESDADYKERIHKYHMSKAKGALGRYYIFSLIQGLISRKIISFTDDPERKPEKLIVFSYADGWLTTDKYGTFSDMWEKCNESVALQDNILTVQGIHPDFRGWGNTPQYEWNNDRGRGEKNRTHDVAADNNTIYPINLVEHYATYDVVEEHGPDRNEARHTWTDEELKLHQNAAYWRAVEVKKVEGSDRYKYFISLEKTENWETGKAARANFEVYKDEFINLTYMNSVWIEYVINNQKTSDIRIGGQRVDFAYLLRYLNTILQHCREREDQFSSWIREIGYDRILDDEEWPVKLSEWMIKNNIHNFSKFRAKQFSKFVIENKN